MSEQGRARGIRATVIVAAMLPIVGVALSGCLGFDRLARVQPVIADAGAVDVNLDTFRFPGSANTAYQDALHDTSGKSRNELQAYIMRKSETPCRTHLTSIHTNAAVFNVATGFLTSALAGAAAIVTGQTASNILAGGAALSNSTRSLVNEEVYQRQIAAAVITEIEENRKTEKTTLEAKRTQSTTLYTVDDAILDAARYHEMCSFYDGMASLAKKAGKSERSRDDLVGATMTKLRQEYDKDKATYDELHTRLGQETAGSDLHQQLELQKRTLLDKMNNTQQRLKALDAML
jgi:hypothetical protein